MQSALRKHTQGVTRGIVQNLGEKMDEGFVIPHLCDEIPNSKFSITGR